MTQSSTKHASATLTLMLSIFLVSCDDTETIDTPDGSMPTMSDSSTFAGGESGSTGAGGESGNAGTGGESGSTGAGGESGNAGAGGESGNAGTGGESGNAKRQKIAARSACTS